MEVIVILCIFFLGIPYIVLAILAYKHFNGTGSKKVLAAGPWWAFYSRDYDEKGKVFCKYGRFIIVIAVPISLVSLFV
jgi:hypothetical protein